MATFITDPFVEQRIRAGRAESGTDRYDEVWEGTYMMTPAPTMDHQRLVGRITAILGAVITESGLGEVFPGANVSDREDDWAQNFREPDVVVMLQGGRAKDCGTHLCGGPDFLIEIISPHDRGREKLEFYAQIGVRELLIVDRDPSILELYRLHDGGLELASQSRAGEPTVVTSDVVPLAFRLLPGRARPQIEVTHRDGIRHWTI